MFFDLEVAGHHPGYIRHLLRYWPDATAHLIFVVSPEFAAQNGDVVNTVTKAQVTWLPITQAELAWYEMSKRSLVRRAWVEWRLYCHYAQKLQANQGLIMYIDRFQLPLALRLGLPCPTSGIYFRPKFHYGQFADNQTTRKEQWRSLRERWLWHSALHHPQLKTIFSLDPFAVKPLRTISGNTNIIPLPDPIEWYPSSANETATLRQELGIDPARKVLLLFGMLDQRKGIYQVLEALQQLPPAQQAQITLLLLGAMAEREKVKVLTRVESLRQQTPVQIIFRDQFIPAAAISAYFSLSDVALALYQRHVGSSGILIWAAAAGKPVLASNYGLMGETVRKRKLGMTMDSADPAAIAEQIGRLFAQSTELPFAPTELAQFAKENSAEAFVQQLWQNLAGEQSHKDA